MISKTIYFGSNHEPSFNASLNVRVLNSSIYSYDGSETVTNVH